MSQYRVIQSGRFKGKKIEMAPTSGMALVRDVAEDFMRKIFEMEPGDYLISDKSSLRDFIGFGEETLEAIHARIQDAYGVDVSGIPEGTCSIFSRGFAASSSRELVGTAVRHPRGEPPWRTFVKN